MFVAAYLLLSGKISTPQEALGTIKKHRPQVQLHPAQWELLEQFNQLNINNHYEL